MRAIFKLDRRILVAGLTLCLLGMVGTPGVISAEGTEWIKTLQREPLRGLTGVNVLVEAIESEMVKYGVPSREMVQTKVELRLRSAGIQVLTEDESIKSLGSPYLYINLNPMKLPADKGATYNIDINLKENVRLVRNPSMSCFAATWHVSCLGGASSSQITAGIQQSLDDLIDEFINDYLAVNPKK